MSEEVAGPARRRRRQLTSAMEEAASGENEAEAAQHGEGGKPEDASAGAAPDTGGEQKQDAVPEVHDSGAAKAPPAGGGGGSPPVADPVQDRAAPGTTSAVGNAPSAPKKDEVTDERILQVTVYGTEELKANIHLIHPVIKMSIVDTEDGGKLMKKPRQGRNVVQQNENATTVEILDAISPRHGDGNPSPLKSSGYDRILPVLTQPFDLSTQLRDGKQLKCEWNEIIGLDERLAYFLNPRYLFFFELLDFVHSSDEMENVNMHNRSQFWKHIAWGFVRPNKGGEGYIRTGQRLRLQLYKYRSFWFWQKKPSSDLNTCQAYHQWAAGRWKPYKSTLSVTIDGIARPEDRYVENRAKMPWEREEGQEDLAGQLKARQQRDDAKRRQWRPEDSADGQRIGKKWLGSTGKWCRIPNVPMHRVDTDHRGCFVLAFSSFGQFLACATGGRTMYRIKLFNVATGALVKTLPGHQEIVYDMQWGLETEDSEFETAATGEDHSAVEGSPGPLLLTASADTTAKVWSLASAAVTATCHHPSYCYAARFCAGPDGVRGDTDSERAMSGCQYVVTGCYDTHLRLWDVRADSVGESGAAQIVKLISGHSSHVNSLAMDGDVTKLYSADGVGQIRVWSLARHAFDCVKEINEPEIKGDALNCLRLDKAGKRLVVLARDHCIRMLDVSSDRCPIVQRFTGLRCSQHQIRCDLSPDGRYLMSGSEDGQVHVWNVDTGELDTSTPKDRMPRCTGMSTDVAWNPAERIVAVCSFTRRHPVLLHKYERDHDALASEEMAEEEVRDVLAGKFEGLAQAFEKMDTSGDGKLSISEFRAGLGKMDLGLTDVQVLRIFRTAAQGVEEIDKDDFIKRFGPPGMLEELKAQKQLNLRRAGRKAR